MMLDTKTNSERTLPKDVTLDVKLAFIVFVSCVFFACYLEFDNKSKSQIANFNTNQANNKLKVYSKEPISLKVLFPVYFEKEEP